MDSLKRQNGQNRTRLGSNRLILIRDAHKAALDRAFEIYGLCFAEYTNEWRDVAAGILMNKAVEFAVHARRVCELCEIEAGSFDKCNIMKIIPRDLVIAEKIAPRLDHALNALIHCKELKVFNLTFSADTKTFITDADVYNIGILRASTDRHEDIFISILGVSFVYIRDVTREVESHIGLAGRIA